MKQTFFLMILFLFPLLLKAGDEMKFEKYFEDKTMRVDYHHTGDATHELITLDQIYQYEKWSGGKKNLLDNFNNGKYYVKAYDLVSGELIFSKGFDSYYGEYEISDPAINGIQKTFHESAIIPCPKNKIRLAFEKRNREKQLEEKWSFEIDPADIMIIREQPVDKDVLVIKSHYSGDPSTKADFVFLGEGYSPNDIEKFKSDVNKFTEVFLKYEPYKSMKEHINIWGVLKPGEESGIDEPRANIYKQTVLNATFNSMGSERYVLTEDNKSMRDLAAFVPYDAICIMINHKRYGGGGIYNSFCTFTTDNQFHEYLLVHEFGHSFSGLADEYYTSSTSYNDFYPRGIEPVEPNITALLDPANLKWKHLIDTGIEIPTPWEKKDFDEMDTKWQIRRAEMNEYIAKVKREKASADVIKKAEDDYAVADKSHSEKVDKYLQSSKYRGKVGVYEGAGYCSEDMYRPMLDCIMFSKGAKPYCRVCEDVVRKKILFYAE